MPGGISGSLYGLPGVSGGTPQPTGNGTGGNVQENGNDNGNGNGGTGTGRAVGQFGKRSE
ncbi:hypothetical protein FRC12_014075 [Ceratobasidium sp. 428]|nr:hypothetical protein FRC12_014075 [Ceratobasidium sp. 428]